MRSELLLNEDELSSDYELESAFVIKNGWLNVISEDGRRPQRLWISLTLQNLSLSTTFKAAQPDESISIELCEAFPMHEQVFFRLVFFQDEVRSSGSKMYCIRSGSWLTHTLCACWCRSEA